MTPIIKTINVSKSYRQGQSRVDAVKGVDLTIEKAGMTAIIGHSGAGKSTLLHMMGGLDRPSGGTVLFDGKDIYRLNDRERSLIRNRRVGFIFQFYNLLQEFTVLENVMMPALIGRRSGMSKAGLMKKAAGMLENMGLGRRLDHKTPELSGGEAQRVAIARALMNDPEVLLCDEPTGNLDSAMGAQIYGILYDINKTKGTGIIIVTHHLHKSHQFDTMYVMRDGLLKTYDGSLEVV